MSQKSNDLPGWFPFALTASFLIAVAAGYKSGWKLSPAPPKNPDLGVRGLDYFS